MVAASEISAYLFGSLTTIEVVALESIHQPTLVSSLGQ